MPTVKPADIAALKGKDIGASEWIMIDQARIDAFATCTEDDQFIHVDPARAASETPFGGAVAHGFLTLSMLSKLARGVAIAIEGAAMRINYGFEKVRFLTPVRAGRRVRGRFALKDATERKPGEWVLVYDVTVDIEDEDKPALVAEWLTMQVLGEERKG